MVPLVVPLINTRNTVNKFVKFQRTEVSNVSHKIFVLLYFVMVFPGFNVD